MRRQTYWVLALVAGTFTLACVDGADDARDGEVTAGLALTRAGLQMVTTAWPDTRAASAPGSPRCDPASR